MRGPAAADPGAIVLGGSYRALAVVRSLGRHGVPVWVARTDDSPLAGLSRYAARSFDWRRHTPEQTVAGLLDLARSGAERWIVVPCDDEDTQLLAVHHDRIAARLVPAALPWERLRWALDKECTYELARRCGVAYPRTWKPGSREALDALDLPFPVIVKPVQHPRNVATVAPKAWPAPDRHALDAAWAQARRRVPADELLIQELVPGGGTAQLAYAALCDDGEVIASLAARRTRQRPMDFGKASTFVETVDDGAVAEPARRLLRAARFTGMVEVEFKHDPARGPLLLDVNPRPWGWLSIGPRAGVDFSWLLWRLLSGKRVEPCRGRPGVRWVRLTTDIPTAAGEVVSRRLRMRDWLASMRPPIDFATLNADDPLPGLVEPPALAWLGIRRYLEQRPRWSRRHRRAI